MARTLAVVRGARTHGRGGVLLASGPAGIGKTALLGEVCQQADRSGLRVASAKFDRVDQVGPAAPVLALLRTGREPLTSAPEFEELTRLVAEPLLLADRIAAALEATAAEQPLLIALDDLQWADRVSRFLLRVLLSRLVGLPVVWLLAGRDDGLGAELTGPDLSQHHHLKLGPLTTSDMAAIAQDRLGRVPDERVRGLLMAAAGNPFLAIEILNGIMREDAQGHREQPESQTPVEFTEAIAHQFAQLTGPARELVRLVAVAGRTTIQEAAALSPAEGGAEQALTEAVKSGLIMYRDGAVSFRHDLVRDAVYAAMSPREARRMHLRLAEHHLEDSGTPQAAAAHARAAAAPGDLASAQALICTAEALAGVSAGDAGELAALAFHTVRPAQPQWLDLSLRSLAVLCRTQSTGEAVTVADLILARIDDSDLAGQVETQAARALWLGGRVRELTARTDRILRLSDLTPTVTARLLAVRALAATRTETGEVAAANAEAAVSYARGTGDRDALMLALQAAGEAARNQSRHADALACFRDLRAMAGTSYLAEEITTLQFLDRYDHAQALLDRVKADNQDATETLLPAVMCAQLWQDFNLGRLDEADTGARGLADLSRQIGNGVHLIDAIVIQTAVALLRGRVDAAAAHLRRADPLYADIRSPGLAVMRGWLAITRGDLATAMDVLRPVLEGASGVGSYWPLWPCWNGLFFEIGTAAQDQGFSADCVQVAELAAARNPGVASFEGVALNTRGRSTADLDMIGQSADVLARSPRPLLRAVGADTYGRALLAAGDRTAGLEQLDRAWDDYHLMGAWAWSAEIQRTMRQAGTHRAKWSTGQPRPATGWAALSDAERRVAALIGSGHTNKTAAAQLGVSVNTVATHLRSLFTKLGIQSRVQLANELHKHSELDPQTIN